MIAADFFGQHARHIFDLLIYRCTEVTYWDEQKADCDKFIRNLDCDPSSKAQHVENLSQHWFEQHGGWTLSEAVGLIALFAAPAKLGGLFYFVNRRVAKNIAQRRVFFRGMLFEFNVWPEDGNDAIYETLRKRLQGSSGEIGSLKNRVIDFGPFRCPWPASRLGKSHST
jgi:hypothetical protein